MNLHGRSLTKVTGLTAGEFTYLTDCYLGDGRNNTANSLLVTGALLGMDTPIVAPAALHPAPVATIGAPA